VKPDQRNYKFSKTSSLLQVLFAAAILMLVSANFSIAFPQGKKLKIEWDKVAGATGYAVEIKDDLGALVIDKKTTDPLLEFFLEAGNYKMRIGSINKFEKVSVWSDWEDITIEYSKDFKKKIEPCKPYPAIRLSVGWIMTQPLQPWDSLLDLSFYGAGLNLGFFYADGFWRHLGFELDVSYNYYQGKTVTTKMNNILIGGNLFLRTDFTMPLNLIIRGGGGVALSNLEYKNVFSGLQDIMWNYSPYYKIGAALEVKLYKNLFIEAGMDYSEIFYGVNFGKGNVRAFQYFAKAGYEFDIRTEPPLTDEEKKRKIQYLQDKILDKSTSEFKRSASDTEVVKCDSGTAVKLSIGYPLMQSFPLWANVYPFSYAGAAINIALYGKQGVFKYAGYEIDSSYSYYQGATPDINFNQIMVGGSIFFRSSFNFPLNFIIRGGGGFAVSILHQPSPFGGAVTNSISYDPYWKAGISLEYEFVKPLFFEAGAEFINIIYEKNQFYGIKYFLMFGFKIM
jgi:hypothetical protein